MKSILDQGFETKFNKLDLANESFSTFADKEKGKEFLIDLFKVDKNNFSNFKLLIQEFNEISGTKKGTKTPIM